MRNLYLMAVIALIFSGCAKNEKDIFPVPAAERLSQSLETNLNILIHAPNGWVMEYFANPESGGYPLLVKFETSGQAIFAASNEFTENKAYETDSCLFRMIGDNGPVLTFDTFNKILHVFSNPIDPKGSTDLDGDGLKGDYEFVVLQADSSKITLRGKKMVSTVRLTKLPENTSWLQYVSQLENLNALLFENSTLNLTMKIGKSQYSLSKGENHIFTIQKLGSSSLPIVVPFIITPQGIRFYEIQDFEGIKVQYFELNQEKSALVCLEQPDIKLVGQEDLAAYFMRTVKAWEFIPEELSANVKVLYDQITQSCVTNYNAENIQIALKYFPAKKYFGLSLTFNVGNTLMEGNIDLSITNAKNSLTIVNKGTADTNGTIDLNDVEGLSEMSNLIAGSFTLSTATSINPKSIKLTKKSDTTTWITIK